MDRTFITTPELSRAYDHLKGWSRAARSIGLSVTDFLGGYGTNGGPAAQVGASPIAGLPVGFTGASPGQPGGGNSLQPQGAINGFPIINISTNTFSIDVGTVYDMQKQ